MISKFLTSEFSGYLALLGIAVILGLVWYVYKEGKDSCVGAVATETVRVDQQSRKDSHEVHKEVQSLNDTKLDSKLCSLGIVRKNSDCK